MTKKRRAWLPRHEQILRGAVDRLKKMRPEQVTPKVVCDVIYDLVMGKSHPGFEIPARKP